MAQPQIFWLDSQNDVDITDWGGLKPPKKMTQLKEPSGVLFFRYLLEVTCLIEKFIATHSLKGRTHYTVQPSALHICDTARRHVRNGTAIFSKVPATPLMLCSPFDGDDGENSAVLAALSIKAINVADHKWQVDFSVITDIETFASATISKFWGSEYGKVHVLGEAEEDRIGRFTGVFALFLRLQYLHTLSRTVCTPMQYVNALCEREIQEMKRKFPPLNNNSALSTQGNIDEDPASKAVDESVVDLVEDDTQLPAVEEDEETIDVDENPGDWNGVSDFFETIKVIQRQTLEKSQ